LPVGDASATTTFTQKAVNDLLKMESSGTRKDKKMIETKIKQRAVLGSTAYMTRTSYAYSPSLEHLNFSRQREVNAADVPSSMGKTTACHAFMKKYIKKAQLAGGFAFPLRCFPSVPGAKC
jgi:hypothetical protein